MTMDLTHACWWQGPSACPECLGLGMTDPPGRKDDPDDEGVPCIKCDGTGVKFANDADYP